MGILTFSLESSCVLEEEIITVLEDGFQFKNKLLLDSSNSCIEKRIIKTDLKRLNKMKIKKLKRKSGLWLRFMNFFRVKKKQDCVFQASVAESSHTTYTDGNIKLVTQSTHTEDVRVEEVGSPSPVYQHQGHQYRPFYLPASVDETCCCPPEKHYNIYKANCGLNQQDNQNNQHLVQKSEDLIDNNDACPSARRHQVQVCDFDSVSPYTLYTGSSASLKEMRYGTSCTQNSQEYTEWYPSSTSQDYISHDYNDIYNEPDSRHSNNEPCCMEIDLREEDQRYDRHFENARSSITGQRGYSYLNPRTSHYCNASDTEMPSTTSTCGYCRLSTTHNDSTTHTNRHHYEQETDYKKQEIQPSMGPFRTYRTGYYVDNRQSMANNTDKDRGNNFQESSPSLEKSCISNHHGCEEVTFPAYRHEKDSFAMRPLRICNREATFQKSIEPLEDWNQDIKHVAQYNSYGRPSHYQYNCDKHSQTQNRSSKHVCLVPDNEMTMFSSQQIELPPTNVHSNRDFGPSSLKRKLPINTNLQDSSHKHRKVTTRPLCQRFCNKTSQYDINCECQDIQNQYKQTNNMNKGGGRFCQNRLYQKVTMKSRSHSILHLFLFSLLPR